MTEIVTFFCSTNKRSMSFLLSLFFLQNLPCSWYMIHSNRQYRFPYFRQQLAQSRSSRSLGSAPNASAAPTLTLVCQEFSAFELLFPVSLMAFSTFASTHAAPGSQADVENWACCHQLVQQRYSCALTCRGGFRVASRSTRRRWSPSTRVSASGRPG